jgi:hypothetical protein
MTVDTSSLRAYITRLMTSLEPIVSDPSLPEVLLPPSEREEESVIAIIGVLLLARSVPRRASRMRLEILRAEIESEEAAVSVNTNDMPEVMVVKK